MKKALLGLGLVGAVGAAATYGMTRRSNSSYVSPNAKRAVVLGAGFAGLNAAKTLARGRDGLDLDVLLIDRFNFHLFTPILYQVATGGVGPDNIAHPVRYVARASGFRFQESTVEGVDLEKQVVRTDDGEVPFDYLVVALGATANFFGMKEVEENSLTLKTLGDGINIRNKIIDAFERAEVETDPEQRRALLTFIVVGAGPTGVELATSIRDLITKVLLKDYPKIAPAEARVLLVEALPKALPMLAPDLAENAVRTMRSKGVEILLETPVVSVDEQGARTKSGELIPAKTVIWTAGVKASEIIASLPGEKGRDGRVRVNRYLQVEGHPNVYVVGDCAMYFEEGAERPLPPNAPVAIEEGKTAARNILRDLRGEDPEVLHYVRQGELVSLGRSNAVADIMGIKLTGIIGWLTWRLVYVTKLMGAKNRLGILLDWTFNTFNKRETSKLNVEQGPAQPGR